MPLVSGTKLGPYEISAPLGAGGMGEVYRALDTRHGFSGARERMRALRVVFSSDPRTRAALARLKLDNLDKGILGGEFPEDIITVSKNVDHFKLMATEHVVRQVDELVAEARAVSGLNRPHMSGSASS